MQNRLETTSRNVMKWGDDRKITLNGNVATQLLKLNEEFLKEFYESDSDTEKLKDSIGDSMVVLTMIDGILNKDNSILVGVSYDDILLLVNHFGGLEKLKDDTAALTGFLGTISCCIGNMSAIAVRGKCDERIVDFDHRLLNCYIGLMLLAFALDLEPVECFEHAYNQIKDRKGELLPSGVFVKESDLN